MKKFDFVNKIVRQGNSLCIRIPSIVVRQGSLKEGMEANVIISPPEDLYKYNEKNISALIRIANKIKKLDGYDEFKKRFFIMMNFDFLKTTIKSDKEVTEKMQLGFIKKKKEEFGEKLISEFLNFSGILNREAFDTEGDTAILKQKYQKYLQ